MLKRCLASTSVLTMAVLTLSAQPGSGVVGKDVTVYGFKLHYLEAGRGPG